MKSENRSLSRRSLLRLGSLSLGLPLLTSCITHPWKRSSPHSLIDSKSLWARREEWNGTEVVRAIVQIGDRYLMVKSKGRDGWVFPGGEIDIEKYGAKREDSEDLIIAATDYTHDQALVPLYSGEGTIASYGYVIDSANQRTIMVFWLSLMIPDGFLPQPTANPKYVDDVRWIIPGDPIYGHCLKQRMQEYNEIEEGRTIIVKPCYQ